MPGPPPPHRPAGPGLPRAAPHSAPGTAGTGTCRAWRRPCSSPRAGRCRGPELRAQGVLRARRARGQRWGAAGPGKAEARGSQRRKVTQSLGQERGPRARTWREDCGGCFWLPANSSSGFLPAAVTGAAALQGRAAQATAGLCGDRKKIYAMFWSAFSISVVTFFIEKKESLAELPLFLQ